MEHHSQLAGDRRKAGVIRNLQLLPAGQVMLTLPSHNLSQGHTLTFNMCRALFSIFQVELLHVSCDPDGLGMA